MAGIEYTQSAGGYNLNTPMPSFGFPSGGGGLDFSGLNSFYQQMAARKAAEEAKRRAEEQRRQDFQEKMQAAGFNMNAEEHKARMRAIQDERARAMAPKMGGSTKTFANLPGIGQVEVAPGTQSVNSPQLGPTSVYQYATGNSDEAEANAAQRGFRPGLVGADVGLTGWAAAAKDFSRDPEDFERAKTEKAKREYLLGGG